MLYALLRQTVGKRLNSVHYYVLPGEFDIDEPNESGGCQVVRLVFEDSSQIAFDWIPESAREDGLAYRMDISDAAARPHAVRTWTYPTPDAEIADTNGLDRLDASASRVWRSLVGQRLEATRILGVASSEAGPFSQQAASLQFPSGEAFISIGMSSWPVNVIIGDGDEVLVFDAPGWKAALTRSPYGDLTECESGVEEESL